MEDEPQSNQNAPEEPAEEVHRLVTDEEARTSNEVLKNVGDLVATTFSSEYRKPDKRPFRTVKKHCEDRLKREMRTVRTLVRKLKRDFGLKINSFTVIRYRYTFVKVDPFVVSIMITPGTLTRELGAKIVHGARGWLLEHQYFMYLAVWFTLHVDISESSIGMRVPSAPEDEVLSILTRSERP